MNLLHFREADRLPAVHFGYWQELLDEWAEQGHITRELAATACVDGSAAQKELDRLLGWDCNWYTVVAPQYGLFPPFERKVLSVLPDGSHRVQSENGVIERVKPGIVSIPSEDDYLLKDREAFESLFRPRMQFLPERIDEVAIRADYEERSCGDVPVGLHLGSVMGQIRDITTVVGMSYLMYDEDEELFAEIVDTYAEMQYRCAEAMLSLGLSFDFAHYWEDICFKNGPLLSPSLFDELCTKHYKKRNELCHKHGIDIISLDCDGVTEALLESWISSGVNVMFPIEIGTWGDQFEAARQTYGTKVLGVGGMDKTALRKDRESVDAEIERMKRLVSLGGFLPCPDHRLMPGTDFDLVRYYIERIKAIRP